MAALAKALTRENAPALRRLQLGHNRVGSAGAAALAHFCSPSPELDWVSLDENWIGDEGAAALAAAVDAGTLRAREIRLSGNHAISKLVRGQLKARRDAPSFDFGELVDAISVSQPIDDSHRAWTCQRE